jgi:hypothetical protein
MSIFDRFKLTGKRLFITGGSRGLGREMVVAIADAGADVILVGRDQPSLDKTAGDIRALGRQAWTLAADVGKPAECEQACQSALERHGPIDILINNVLDALIQRLRGIGFGPLQIETPGIALFRRAIKSRCQRSKVVIRAVWRYDGPGTLTARHPPAGQRPVKRQVNGGGRPCRRRRQRVDPHRPAGHRPPDLAVGEDHERPSRPSRRSSAGTQSRFTPVSASCGSSTRTAPVRASRPTNAIGR